MKESHEPESATLGDVVYANQSASVVVEEDWVALVSAIAEGSQPALHALYERSHRLVFTLAMRITRNRETAEEVTIDVFHDVWRRAAHYDASNGTVLGWIMNQARSRTIDRLRHDHRKKRVDPRPEDPNAPEPTASASDDLIAAERQRRALHAALAVLSPDEKAAIEAAFFGELTHAQVADKLGQPLGTIKTRIRSGLHKLRDVFVAEAEKP